MPPLITKSLQSLIGSFDDDITFENEDLIEFNFDPLSVNSQGNVIFQDLYDVFNADYRAIMGDEVNLKKLPIVSKSFNRNDSNARENERKYFQFRDAVSEVANSSAVFSNHLPQFKKKQFIDEWTSDVYGLYQTSRNMLPPESDERDELKTLFDQQLISYLEENMSPLIKKYAGDHARGWVGGDPGEYGQSAVAQLYKTKALAKQSQSDVLAVPSTAYQYLMGNPAVHDWGVKKTASLIGEQIRESGEKDELEAEEWLATLQKPTGKYLESVGDLGITEGLLNPYYAWVKLIENAPNQVLTTGVGLAGGLAASAMVTTGVGATIGATLFGQLPGLMINYSLEAGDMYGSSRDYLYELRDEARRNKGKVPAKDFLTNYEYFISEGNSVTADKLSDTDIHNISKDLSTLYGLISTGIEGMTNVGSLAKWLRGHGNVVSKSMATKEGKEIMGKAFAKNIGKNIRNFSQSKPGSAVFAGGMEGIQEAVQEGTGELMRSQSLPGYNFDTNVVYDAAYSGMLFGKSMQAGISLQERYRKKRDLDPGIPPQPKGRTKWTHKYIAPDVMERNWADDLVEDQVARVKNEVKDESDLEALLKAGILMYDMDVTGLARALESDPVKLGEIENKIYDLQATRQSWEDADNLTEVFSGRLKLLETALGMKESDLEASRVDFNEAQISKIYGKPYTKAAEDMMTDQDVNLTEDNSPVNDIDNYTYDPSQEMPDPDYQMAVTELPLLKDELKKTTDPETIKSLETDIKEAEEIIIAVEGARPKPGNDPNAQVKQNIVNQVRNLKVKLTPEEYNIINSSQRKNASQESIDNALKVIEDNKDKKPPADDTGAPTIVYGETGKKHKGGAIIAASYNREKHEITLDKDALKKKYEEKAWTDPKVKGVMPIAKEAFKTYQEFENFVIEHELAHSKSPKRKGESKAKYENRMNQTALKAIALKKKLSEGRTPEQISFDQAYGLEGAEPDPNKRFGITYKKDSQKEKAELEVKFSEDGKTAVIDNFKVILSEEQQAKLKDIEEGLNSENAMEKGFAQEDQEALQNELLEDYKKESTISPTSIEDLELMTIPQIKEAAKNDGIKLKGKLKADLIKSYDQQTGMSQGIDDDGSYDAFESKVRQAEIINLKYDKKIESTIENANVNISRVSIPEDRQEELEQIQDIEDDKDNTIRVLKEQRQKELARIGMQEETPVMTEEDAKIQAKNIEKIIIDNTFADINVPPEDLDYMERHDPTSLLELAKVKKVPELENYREEDGGLNFDPDNLAKLKQAILVAQGPTMLSGGFGGFPLTKKSTKQRLDRWFEKLWRQASEKFGYLDEDFHPWANTIGEYLPDRYQGYWREWALKSPIPQNEYDSKGIFAKLGRVVSDTESPEGFSPEELAYTLDAIDDYGRKENPMYEEQTDDSGGDVSFKEGWNRVNAIAFEPLGLYLEGEESSYIRKMVNIMPDFDSWIQKISEVVPLPEGKTIWEASQDPKIRAKLKTLYVSSLNRNVQRINRDQIDKGARVNIEFEVDSEGNFVVNQIKGKDSRQKIGKLNTQWARKMHGENYLGDIDLIWASGSDILAPQLLRDTSGNPRKSTRWGRFIYGLKKRYSFFTADELNDLTNTYFKELGAIPVFVRGEEDQMALVKITQAHRDLARNPENYWANEDLPNKMKNEYMDGDNFIIGANIARHEAMKQIFGSDYHTLSAQKIMQRVKAFFTPGISVEGGPPSKVVVFDPTNVKFVTRFRNGNAVTQSAMQNIDGKMQYIGDGNTITSERKFKYTYPSLLGTDARAKRAKTIIGAHDETGVLIGKHQEMSMYVPSGAKMEVMDGDKVIAVIESNGDTTDITVNGQYVDHLMTEDEAKIRLGNFNTQFGEIFEIPSEATTHIQAVGSPKSHANFPMQLMNYITDRVLQDAVSSMMVNQSHNKSTKELIKNIFDISKSGKKLDEFLVSLKDRLDDAPPQYVTSAAELGAGRHPSNQGTASILANSKYMKKAMSVMQDGAVLDFRPDYSNAVNDDEVLVPSNVPAIRNQIYQKYADAHGITLKEAKSFNLPVINKWLRENDVRVLLVRFPVPSALGYGVFKVKGLMGPLSGDSFIVSPKVVKERFEGDHDHDTGHLSFLDDNILDLLQRNQQPTQGINLEQYLPDDYETSFSYSNLGDMYKLMEELSYGSKAIGEIANVQRIAGVAQNHFEHMVLDGQRIVQVKLDSVIKDPNMIDKNGNPVEDTLGNIFRIYAQASFDNAKFRLLARWGYSQDNLFKLMFKNADGSELTDRQFNTFKTYLKILRMNGYIANSGNTDGRHTLKDTFDMSKDYRSFVDNRVSYVTYKMNTLLKNLSEKQRDNYADVGEISLKDGNIHPHETLSMMPDRLAEQNNIDVEELFNIDSDVQRSAIIHNEASLNIVSSQARSNEIIDASDGDVSFAITESNKGGQWAQSMINALDALYIKHRSEGNSLSEVVSQTWDYNDEFLKFAKDWYEGGENIVGFKDLSLTAQKAATYDFLSGLRRRNMEGGSHASYNTKMIPPVSKDGVTLLDPDIMERYFNEYNNLYENKYSDMSKVKIPKKFTPMIKTSEEIKRTYNCE